ncbi:MAG: CDP-diacylglycerol--glycerol-3-phosphate 3-phosphatidyltransferase [Acidobacteriia bacterium]|nr:CDP-diacylglycerol--glycerol-3-phosphate 3-phosphatidyltransferase [Terriglobia bacterium]
MIRQLGSAPNLLTLLRLIFIPFIVIAVQQHAYTWALVIFVVAGITDGLDGLLARLLQQKTTLGQYLDPIADKLLLSTMFLVLAVFHLIRWPVTVLVFSRDILIVIVCTLLYATGTMRTFRPSWLGKANTLAQIVTVPFALMSEVSAARWIHAGKHFGVYATVGLTILSGVHYVVRVAMELRHHASSKAPEDGG